MNELIDALRNHRVCDDDKCKTCELMDDAAAALEAAEKRIAELEKQEPTEKQVVDYCHKRCLVIVEVELFQRMKATFSKLPKEGEWIYTPLERYKEYKVKCPFCGAEYHDCYDGYIDAEDMNYCPNCGSVMKKGELL